MIVPFMPVDEKKTNCLLYLAWNLLVSCKHVDGLCYEDKKDIVFFSSYQVTWSSAD